MPLASMDLIRAREAARQLLEQLGLETYLFELEPGQERWRLLVECEVGDGWRTTALDVSREELLASAADAAIFTRLLETWRARLDDCCRQGDRAERGDHPET